MQRFQLIHASSCCAAELKIKFSIGWSVCPDIFNFARTLSCFGWAKKNSFEVTIIDECMSSTR